MSDRACMLLRGSDGWDTRTRGQHKCRYLPDGTRGSFDEKNWIFTTTDGNWTVVCSPTAVRFLTALESLAACADD